MMRPAPAAMVLLAVRLAAGPLALAGFLLPWTHGPGVLAPEYYSGFDLVRLTGVLQQLDLPAAQSVTLIAVRVLLVGMPVAAVWLTLLAPAHRWHPVYPVAGAYLVLATAGLLIIALFRIGIAIPTPGLALLLASAAAIVVPWLRLAALSPRATRLPNPRLATRRS